MCFCLVTGNKRLHNSYQASILDIQEYTTTENICIQLTVDLCKQDTSNTETSVASGYKQCSIQNSSIISSKQNCSKDALEFD